jgi:hypothetical protein
LHTHRSSCFDSNGECKRRFPRTVFQQTMVDPNTGALNLKKGEPWMNTVTPALTYILRCNSDVTSLLSGTAVKAVVAYVTDYITKQSLKTYSVFDVIKCVFDQGSEILGGDLKRKEKVRKLFTQIVNSLTSKLEIGGPMASLYILGNPDHYVKHQFIPCFWRGYVKEVFNAWENDDDDEDVKMFLDDDDERVIINKNKNSFIQLSKVDDYMYRPQVYENVCLYDWVRFSRKTRRKRLRKTK